MNVVAAVLILIVGCVALALLYYPLVADLIARVTVDRQARQLREAQQLAEARLRLLTFATLRQMQEVAREQQSRRSR